MNHESPESHSQQAAANFFGGLTVTVVHEDGRTEDVKVRQLRLADYETALQIEKDEFALTAFCCQKIPLTANTVPLALDKNWLLTLQPDSYEQLRAKVEEVNTAGFFSFARRKAERESAAKQEMFQIMSQLPPGALKAFSEASRSLSTPQSPRPQSR